MQYRKPTPTVKVGAGSAFSGAAAGGLLVPAPHLPSAVAGAGRSDLADGMTLPGPTVLRNVPSAALWITRVPVDNHLIMRRAW